MFSYLFPSLILTCFLVLPLTCLSHVFYWPLFPIRISSFPSDDYRFVENAIIILRSIHYIITVFGSFIINGCWLWLNVFSGSCDLCLIVFLELLICVWNQSCIPVMKPVWSCYMIFLMCYWIHKSVLRICASMFMKEIWL